MSQSSGAPNPTFDERKKFAEQSGLQFQAQRRIRDYDEDFLAPLEAIHNDLTDDERVRHLEQFLSTALPYLSEKTLKIVKEARKEADAISGEIKTAIVQVGVYGHALVIEQAKSLGSRSHLPVDSPAHFSALLQNEDRLRRERRFEILVWTKGFVEKELVDQGLIPRKPKEKMPGIGINYGGSADKK